MIETLKKQLERLIDGIEQSKNQTIPTSNKIGSSKSSLHDFNATKQQYKQNLAVSALNSAKITVSGLNASQFGSKNANTILSLQTLISAIKLDDPENASDKAFNAIELCEELAAFAPKHTSIKTPHLPETIRDEVASDIHELEKCMAAGCYRSATILCGRILETALHAKYYQVTGFDILEKNPGIGLGNLIAKLAEKNVALDPGLTQQIHLINQVRVFSVHKKQEPFNPSYAQAEAMTLYTIDSLEKLFSDKKHQ